MKRNIITMLSALLITACAWAQSNADYGLSEEWTRQEIKKANTAKNERNLSQEERNVFLWVNLARLYPQKFVRCEVEPYEGEEIYGFQYKGNNSYKASLVSHLRQMRPTNALYPSLTLFSLALDWAAESGRRGVTGHDRPYHLNVKMQRVRYFGECCSYGHDDAKGIVMGLLIDNNVPSLGHRKNLLSTEMEFDKMGVSIQSHTKYRNCCVIDLSKKKYVD